MSGRILCIFTVKSLIYSVCTGFIGYIITRGVKSTFAALGIILFFASIGFAIATFKMPDTNSFAITRATGGENIDEVVLRAIKFKMKKRRIYLYTKEESK